MPVRSPRYIAIHFGEAGSLERSGLVAAGLALFLLTLVVNLIARRIVARSAAVEVTQDADRRPTSSTSRATSGRTSRPRTTAPARPRKLSGDDLADATPAAIIAAARCRVASLRMLLAQHGLMGTALWWYIGFLVVYFLLVRDRADAESARSTGS